jgi:glyoxylase-like metal-dependent hydrolase (beta-lactamase superfamily II)
VSKPIAEAWFGFRQIDDGITLVWEPYVEPLIRSNIWHVAGRDRDLLVDTGLGICSLREAAGDLFARPVIALATHGHGDHVGGLHEFETRVCHRLEAEAISRPQELEAQLGREVPQAYRERLGSAVNSLTDELVTAYPHAGFDPRSYVVRPAVPTWLVDEGDVIDLGDRSFEVLHLPGHTPGCIGVWEAKSGILFSGDAVYDGDILDDLPNSSIEAYISTMRRLRELPVSVVHGGHDPSFGRERLVEIAEAYIKRRGGALA